MISRLYIVIRGAVQGVGFRPFIYRIALEKKLSGYVLNSTLGVFIEVEGEKFLLDKFILQIQNEKPKLAVITSFEFSFLDPVGYTSFEIRESKNEKEKSAFILPDISLCNDCLNEMLDPSNRRYLYPFINCTNCGPRFSIIESLPYDRPNTSMKKFTMCEECRKEYDNPLDRRFHAQPIACPVCGPHIELWDRKGNIVSKFDTALNDTASFLSSGKIIALKGLGGFQLLVDASNSNAVNKLRKRKSREEKPFAVMFRSIESVKEICVISPFEERLLCSPESPIVLLKKRLNSNSTVSKAAAPNNPYLGVMLPYTPLHHLLMRQLKFPIVATSANISEEPMCIDEYESLNRLQNIADYFLVHNRPITRHVDDSIAHVILEREMILRRARGYAPLPILLTDNNFTSSDNLLAVGGHLKNTIAIKIKKDVFISQHIGDLSTSQAYSTFTKVIEDFKNLYSINPAKIICDLHEEYLSTKYAKSLNLPIKYIQHHYAHIASCRTENRIKGKALGVAWDGTGFGLDGSIWGGEFFISEEDSFEHAAQFKKFMLPSGEAAVKEPRRSALGLLYETFGNVSTIAAKNFTRTELDVIINMLKKKINSPSTSSAGRLFDAVASLLNLSQKTSYEGQAAMMLEYTADPNEKEAYNFDVVEDDILIIDWRPAIKELLNDLQIKLSPAIISGKFHNTLSHIILKVAEIIGEEKILISGGCFQNTLLTEKTIKLLEENNFKVYWHQRVPPNDGGLALGQIAAAGVKYLGTRFNRKNYTVNLY